MIDIFTHVLPPRYLHALQDAALSGHAPAQAGQWLESNAALGDMDARFREMDRFPGLMQVLTLATPPPDTLVAPDKAVELARLANDEIGALLTKYPDRFVAAVACLPLRDTAAAIAEAERAILQLGFRGVQIFTNINGELPDTPRLMPLYARMAELDLPIWIHPWDVPGGLAEAQGIQDPVITHGLRWPYDTSVAMVRLLKAGIVDRYPNIKFITHHCGGMVPFFAGRLRVPDLRRFYADTAVFGGTPSLMCGHAFFGADHLLFGSDMPLGASRQGKLGFTAETIESVEGMQVPQADKDKIFQGNARTLLKLPV